MVALRHWLEEVGLEVGLDLLGSCDARPSTIAVSAFQKWLRGGLAAEMEFMVRPDRAARLVNPEAWDRPYHGLLVAALRYDPPPPMEAEAAATGRVRIAAYACHPDYHQHLIRRLDALAEKVTRNLGPVVLGRSTDTAPILERDAAARAGLGFIGRNTMLINPRLGSWLVLGELRLARPLPVEPTAIAGSCGSCRRCLEQCPTGAIVAPYSVDSRRCISYLTIEHRGWIPDELRPLVGNWIFGCDVCALACPYNRRRQAPRPARRLGLRSASAAGRGWSAPTVDARPNLQELFSLSEGELLDRYRATPVRRAGRAGLLRNLCIAAGNWRNPVTLPWVRSRLADPEPIVRGHAAWALGQLGGPEAHRALTAALRREADGRVCAELQAALERTSSTTT